MTDELIVRARQNCCRLCLAPDSECVPIFKSFAADKEPLSSKIHACVNIKVSESDRLSSRICHSCISYLNSWQSFKNRCWASQIKQRNWLDMAKKTVKKQFDSFRSGRNCQINSTSVPAANSTSPPTKNRPMPLPIKIKQEPPDDDEDISNKKPKEEIDESMKVDVDPTQYLARNEEEEDEPEYITPVPPKTSEGPQILTSLGLTHIKSVNPFSFLSTELGNENVPTSDVNEPSDTIPSATVIEQDPNDPNALPSCRICKVAFSTRANAKRHERNIHGKALDTSTPKLNAKPNIPKAAPTPEMLGIYDYENPEKYRHLLTEHKIFYIRRNEEFLKQYQNLTCKCCPKSFPTYKNFMAHMRKKYPNLGRNLCFKCLKQFQTKSMFVSHLKKRNCINLYKIYLNDDSIAKSGPLALSPDKMGAKELLTNKVYECKICSKTSRLKMEFRAHVYDEHAEFQKKDVPPGSCGFCGLEIDDPVDRKRHYNNMECIVFLRCVTCEEKFDSHQKFIEHVYGAHLPQHLANNNEEVMQISNLESSEEIRDEVITTKTEGKVSDPKMPQNCQICGQHYNNYNNVLRHMESKHPDQLPPTYKCTKCDVGFPRLSMLRNHMLDVHQSKLPKTKKEGIFCRMCSDIFDGPDRWISHQSDQHSRYTCCQCNYQNKNLDEFKQHIEVHPSLNSKSMNNTSSNRYDYVMKDLLSITNGCHEEGDNEREEEETQIKKESPPAKKAKTELDLKECHICHSVFSGNLGLSNHMRAHNAQEQARRSSLPEAKIMTTDISTKTENSSMTESKRDSESDTRFRRMRCRMCQRRFSTKKIYRRHMLIDHHVKNVAFIRCQICQAEFTHEKGLKVHVFKAHGTILTESIEVQFECDVCSTVYRNEEQLNAHKISVHGDEDEEMDETPSLPPPAAIPQNTPKYWFQCRYCPSNFDTNKKLAIHINSHDEFDSNDYSCKDCGNVYSGRKSLWVHRYKKHPLIPDPAPCNICNKTFFDKKMLELHMQTHNQGRTPNNDSLNTTTTNQNDTQNLSADDEEEVNEQRIKNKVIDLVPQVRCSVCSEKFSDHELFSKHMQMHENDLYTDNPLAAMFDTGPEDPNRFFMSRMVEDGAFVCDLCPKRFPHLTALKVHRNWHFRSDSKQLTVDPNAVWRGNTKKKKNSSSHKCQYCNSTFVSSSNLRRHIGELHKREIANGVEPPQIFIEKYLECQKCNMKFQTKGEWIEHKIDHVKSAKHDATFEWGCEICGKLVSRKERLVQHMNSHLREDEQNGNVSSGDQLNNEAEFESNSQDSAASSNDEESSKNVNDTAANEKEVTSTQKSENDNENDDDDDEDGEEEEEELSALNSSSSDDDEDDQENSETEDSSSEQDEDEDDDENAGPYSCDLCQLFFETSKQLQRHVTSHFLNGPGSVTLTELPKEKKIPIENNMRTNTST